MNGNGTPHFWTQAIHNIVANEGLVQIYFNGQVIAALTTQEATDLASALVQASSNAVTTTFLLDLWMEEGATPIEIREKLARLAEWRGAHEPLMGADRARVTRSWTRK